MASNPSLSKNPGLDGWISIGADGRVRVHIGKVDIGQRISTAVALIWAEELDIDPGRIDVARAETGISPDEGITSGSNSMEETGHAGRLAAATARRHLLALAAAALEVDVQSLEVSDGLIQARGTNRSTTYWELLGDRRFDIDIDPEVEIKPPAAYRLVGQKVTARGMSDIVTGRTCFIHDMKMPGMLHGRVVRPPHYHARLRGLDDAVCARLADSGIEIVRDGSFLAVAGEDEYQVVRAAERLAAAADWDMGVGLEPQDLFERLTANERVSLPVVDGAPVKQKVPEIGDPPAGAIATLRARFERPYHMHGSIGPSAALARFENGGLEIWTHSQGIYPLRASMADALDMAPDDVRITHAPGSGCYGHNGADDAAMDAALVARAMAGKPVLLKWSREDEHAWEPYGPAMVMELCASLDRDGMVAAWSHETYSDTHVARPRPAPNKVGASRLLATRHQADALEMPPAQPSMGSHSGIHRNLDPIYTFPARRLVKNLVRNMPLRTSALRTLGAYGNIFAIESFMDELAEAAGADKVEFRLRHLDDERARAVLRAAADALGPLGAEIPAGRGRGIAFARYKNAKTYAAVGVEVEVSDAAEIRLHRAVIAADSGHAVDPDGLAAQLEGGFLQAASWTLHEAVQFDRDGITSRDWDSYPILRFDNIPDIETVVMERPGDPFLGAGEATAGPTAGAIANAVRAATGLRLRRLPFTPDAIRAAALE